MFTFSVKHIHICGIARKVIQTPDSNQIMIYTKAAQYKLYMHTQTHTQKYALLQLYALHVYNRENNKFTECENHFSFYSPTQHKTFMYTYIHTILNGT